MAFINICLNPEDLQSMIHIAEIDGLSEYIANFTFTNSTHEYTFRLPEQLGLVYEHIVRSSARYDLYMHLFEEATAAANVNPGTDYEGFWEERQEKCLNEASTSLSYMRHLECFARKHNPDYSSSLLPQLIED